MDGKSPTILEFENVTVQVEEQPSTGLQDASFRLDAGEIALVEVEESHEHLLLADVAEGLIPPDKGRVAFMGDPWDSMGAQQQSARRGRIHRVFQGDGWISNLDIMENICLAECHHTRRPEAEIAAEALALARRFGLSEIPSTRSARVPLATLRKLEWVRALLGQPDLVLLERPLLGALRADAPLLIEAVAEEARRGAAVLWITDESCVCAYRQFERLKRFRMEGERLRPSSGEGG